MSKKPNPELIDDENPEWTEEMFAQAKRISELPATLQAKLGRPPSPVVRPMVSMRMDPDVLIKLRASGPGWQTRVNALLREAVEQGRV